MRQSFLALLLSLFFVGYSFATVAGENAQRTLIGFSENGRYFAFEQYGVQDGSGFAYAEIFLIDLHQDKWVDGSPYKYQSEDETEPLGVARQTVFTKAAPFLKARGTSFPAISLAHQPLGEPDASPHYLAFGMPGFSNAPQQTRDKHQLSLNLLDVPSGTDCAPYLPEGAKGYALAWAPPQGSGLSPKVLHQDSKIPRSRFCPTDYRISEVVIPFGAFDLRDAVVLLSVFRYGFEGQDRRFIALPLR